MTLPTEPTLITTKLLRRARSALSRGVICYPAVITTSPTTTHEVSHVTIVDPRNALCGQRLKVVSINTDGKDGPICTVEIQKDIWRRIPFSITDAGGCKPLNYPTPLNLALMRQLLDLYQRIEATAKERTSHARAIGESAHAAATGSSGTPSHLESTHVRTETDIHSEDCSALSSNQSTTSNDAGGDA